MIKKEELESLGFLFEDDLEDKYTTYRWTHPSKDIFLEATYSYNTDTDTKLLIEIGTGINWEPLNLSKSQLKKLITILNN